MTRSASATEACDSALTATRGRRTPAPARSPRCSRATTSAERFAAVPPATKQPPAPGGRPARSQSRRSVWFSASIGPADSNQWLALNDAADTSMSNSRAAGVGACGMKAR